MVVAIQKWHQSRYDIFLPDEIQSIVFSSLDLT